MKYQLLLFLFISSFYSDTAFAVTHEMPPIQQGIKYHKISNIQDYWISEKLDGMRGYWDGKQLLSRKGNVINAPHWFIKDFPSTPLDGELWISQNKFQFLISCVRRKKAFNCWKKVKFMMFDLPTHKGTFSERVKKMVQIAQQTPSSYLQMITQFKLKNLNELDKKLDDIIAHHGEGLMLHGGNAHYITGRNSALMKLKRHQDAEAIVIAHLSGKGKYRNMLGALKVKTPEGIIFKIGSGLSDKQRQSPPEIGSIITYKYNGKTNAGIPRFARFWRVRKSD